MTAAEISMTLPADSRFVATARVTTASIAAELEYNLDQIEELRVGANELVALLIEWADDHTIGQIELTFRFSGDALEIEAAAGDKHEPADDDALDALTRQILQGVVDEYEIGRGWGRIVKRRVVA